MRPVEAPRHEPPVVEKGHPRNQFRPLLVPAQGEAPSGGSALVLPSKVARATSNTSGFRTPACRLIAPFRPEYSHASRGRCCNTPKFFLWMFKVLKWFLFG